MSQRPSGDVRTTGHGVPDTFTVDEVLNATARARSTRSADPPRDKENDNCVASDGVGRAMPPHAAVTACKRVGVLDIAEATVHGEEDVFAQIPSITGVISIAEPSTIENVIALPFALGVLIVMTSSYSGHSVGVRLRDNATVDDVASVLLAFIAWTAQARVAEPPGLRKASASETENGSCNIHGPCVVWANGLA